MEVKDGNAGEVLWSNIWNKSTSGKTVTASFDNLQKEKEYAVGFTGTTVNHAVAKATFEGELAQEKSRLSK